MLTLLLVCSFSPRVHSIPRDPRISRKRLSTLNDLLQAIMLRIRATNRTIVGYVCYARFPQMQALASLFACGQPGYRGSHGDAVLRFFKIAINPRIEIKKKNSLRCSFFWWRCGICLSAVVTVGQSRAAEGVHVAKQRHDFNRAKSPLRRHRKTSWTSVQLVSRLVEMRDL